MNKECQQLQLQIIWEHPPANQKVQPRVQSSTTSWEYPINQFGYQSVNVVGSGGELE